MPSPAAVATATSKGRILIVDDEEEIRESLETLLELEGYPVETAPDDTYIIHLKNKSEVPVSRRQSRLLRESLGL